MTDFNHKYKLGELVLYNGAARAVGVIVAYDNRYYLVDWNGEVPRYYTGILAEVEIKKLRNNLLHEIGHEIEEETW